MASGQERERFLLNKCGHAARGAAKDIRTAHGRQTPTNRVSRNAGRHGCAKEQA
jgi:hypothetical protein